MPRERDREVDRLTRKRETEREREREREREKERDGEEITMDGEKGKQQKSKLRAGSRDAMHLG